MSRFKITAALAILPVVAFASPVLADSPGQLTGGSNVLVVKNVTQSGSYGNTVSAACSETVQYSVRLHNAAFGGLTNVQVSANLATGSVSATPDEGTSAGTTGDVDVNVASGGNLVYVNGSTKLYNDDGVVTKTLPDTITTSNVNIGNIAGSTTEFVNFQAKVSCPTPVPVTFTATATATATASASATANANCEKGSSSSASTATASASATASATATATSTVSQADADAKAKAKAQSDADADAKVKAQAQANASAKAAAEAKCSTGSTTTAVKAATVTALPNTGPGDALKLFAGASAFGTAGHFLFRRFRG